MNRSLVTPRESKDKVILMILDEQENDIGEYLELPKEEETQKKMKQDVFVPRPAEE